jgi:hypothetical protein
MSNQSIDKILDSIEKEASQGFDFLLSTGPEFFSTAELLEMRGRWKEKRELFRRLHAANIVLGASSPAWIVLGFIFGALGWQTPALLSLLCFPVLFLLFLGGAFFIRNHFKGRGYLDHVGQLIEGELARRRDDLAKKKF